MVDKAKILAALAQLDPADVKHWTDDGLPMTSVIQKLAADPTIKRTDINEAAPGFDRKAVQAARVEQAKGTETGGAPSVVAVPADEGFEGTSDELRVAMTQRISDTEETYNAAQRTLKAAQDNLRKTEVDVTNARTDFQRKFPPMSVSENLKHHLAQSNQNRIDAAAMRGRSPLDAALAQRNSRTLARARTPSNAGVRGSTVAVAAPVGA